MTVSPGDDPDDPGIDSQTADRGALLVEQPGEPPPDVAETDEEEVEDQAGISSRTSRRRVSP
jgi:hypothetical protein